MTSDGLVIDERKLNHIKLCILQLERENSKTKEKTNDEMVDSIRKLIMDQVNKKY
jgi:hypothetical protein